MVQNNDLADLGRRIDACIAKHGITEADFARVRAQAKWDAIERKFMREAKLAQLDYFSARIALMTVATLLTEEESDRYLLMGDLDLRKGIQHG